MTYLRSTPPSSDALRHSGGLSRLCTSATVTLYLLVLESSDNRPGTEQNISPGATMLSPIYMSFPSFIAPFIPVPENKHIIGVLRTVCIQKILLPGWLFVMISPIYILPR